MASALDKLESYLNDDQQIITKQFCRNDYIDNWGKLQEIIPFERARHDFENS